MSDKKKEEPTKPLPETVYIRQRADALFDPNGEDSTEFYLSAGYAQKDLLGSYDTEVGKVTNIGIYKLVGVQQVRMDLVEVATNMLPEK